MRTDGHFLLVAQQSFSNAWVTNHRCLSRMVFSVVASRPHWAIWATGRKAAQSSQYGRCVKSMVVMDWYCRVKLSMASIPKAHRISSRLLATSARGPPNAASSQSVIATSWPSFHKILPGQKSPWSNTDVFPWGNGQTDSKVSRIRLRLMIYQLVQVVS